MQIGIIAEGHSDRAVIINVISGITGLDESNFQALLPQYKYDATDVAAGRGEIHGGWAAVKNECEKRIFIDEFLWQEGNDFLVIHFDTAESALYNIRQPQKGSEYSSELRTLVINQIISWLGEDLSNSLLYAIAVEETDAWILTLIEDRDSTKSGKAKERLEFKKGLKKGKLKPSYDLYLDFSKEFKLAKPKDINKYLSRNRSLYDFYHEVRSKVIPAL